MKKYYILLLAVFFALNIVSCDDPYDYSEYTNFSDDDDDDDSVVLKYLTLDYTSLSMYVGEEQPLVVSPLPAEVGTVYVTWSSSDETIATVDDDGTVTAVSYGDVTITATSNSDDTISVNCYVSIDETVYYTLSSIPADGSTIDSNTWVITDSGAPSADSFASLRDALYTANRYISLEFPNITAFADAVLIYVEEEDDEDEDEDEDEDDDEDDPIYDTLISVVAPLVTSIGEESFSGCGALQSVELTAVTSIGASAFANCVSLLAVDMPLITEIVERVFYNCESLTTVSFPLVDSIAAESFTSCDDLVSVSLPSITSIPDNAFSWCFSLESITASLVRSIGDWGFGGCRSLTSIDMPLVSSVGDFAFYNGLSLVDVNLPSVEVVGANAFYSCTALESITLATNTVSITIDQSAFDKVFTRDYVTLTTDLVNSAQIVDNVWIVGESSFEFKEIIY